MTYAIAAAGTGGHVFPALAVAEALISLGVEPGEITFFGGDRFEATAVPAAGFDLVQLRLQGLKRSMSVENLRIPSVVWSAVRQVRHFIVARDIRVLLGAGGYVTVPGGIAARLEQVPCFVMEQNAHAGVANRFVARWARDAFTAFETTEGLSDGRWVGKPVRAVFGEMDRDTQRGPAREFYGLDPVLPTVGIVGGSLGARAINEAVASWVEGGEAADVQVVHLVGTRFAADFAGTQNWKVIGFEDDMARFFAASDLVVSRAGGMVAEITATATPSILVPGDFGSKGHQAASAQVLERSGAAVIVPEAELSTLGDRINTIMSDRVLLQDMAANAMKIGKPDAALTVAREMVQAHG